MDSNTGRIHLYIYYRSPAEQRTQMQLRLAQMLAIVTKQTGINGQVLLKQASAQKSIAAENTWMEIYEDVSSSTVEAFLKILNLACVDCGVSALTNGERHVEQFLATTLLGATQQNEITTVNAS